MKKNKIILKILSSLLIVTAISTTATLPISATEINSTSQATIEKKYDLKEVDSVPSNAKILKFDTTEQAEKFIKLVKENKENSVFDLSSLVSDSELKNQIVDLSDKDISEDNFKDMQEILDDSQKSTSSKNNISPLKGMKLKTYKTTLYSSVILGFCSLKGECLVKVDWSSSKGNYISSVRDFYSNLSGLSTGNAWIQYSYKDYISNNGKSVGIKVSGHFDYYLLVNTSLTRLAGEDKDYYMTFYL